MLTIFFVEATKLGRMVTKQTTGTIFTPGGKNVQKECDGLRTYIKNATGGHKSLDALLCSLFAPEINPKHNSFYRDFWMQNAPGYTSNIHSAMGLVSHKLPDWFFYEIKDNRTPIMFRGDKHSHISWSVSLQHISGGRLKCFSAATLELAVCGAFVCAWQEHVEIHQKKIRGE